MREEMPVRHTWSESDRYLPRTVVRPLQRFMRTESAGGVVMLVAAAIALVWANSPWSDAYFDLWSTSLVVELGDLLHLDHLSLQDWVNDALMTAFFLLVGLEIKREVVHGELRNPRAVALPMLAALGGMVVPAVIFALFNHGGDGANGWGIPMATDIAFAVGIVTVAGDRVPPAAKVFLLTLAVTDDVGAIVVIAIFYTTSLSVGWLATAACGIGVILVMRRVDVHALAPYLAVGAFVWLALLESGVHATLAGVILGLLTPAWALYPPWRLPERARVLVDRAEAIRAHGAPYADAGTTALRTEVHTEEELEVDEALAADLVRLAHRSTSPLERLERGLGPWVSFLVVPVFALANAGVRLSGDTLSGLLSDPVVLGVALGLLVGKTVGVFTASLLAVKCGLGSLPEGVTWRQVFGLALVAGVGFTVALFVAGLSFDASGLTDSAKIGILLGSIAAGTLGYLVLRSSSSSTSTA